MLKVQNLLFQFQLQDAVKEVGRVEDLFSRLQKVSINSFEQGKEKFQVWQLSDD